MLKPRSSAPLSVRSAPGILGSQRKGTEKTTSRLYSSHTGHCRKGRGEIGSYKKIQRQPFGLCITSINSPGTSAFRAAPLQQTQEGCSLAALHLTQSCRGLFLSLPPLGPPIVKGDKPPPLSLAAFQTEKAQERTDFETQAELVCTANTVREITNSRKSPVRKPVGTVQT